MFVLAALAVSSGLALRKPRAALFAAVFFIPWAGLDVDAGLRVTAYLVLITPLFVVSTLRGVLRRSKARKVGLGVFWLVIAYAVVWSLVQVPFLPESAVAGGALRQPAVRSMVQIIMFFITISPVWIVPMLLSNDSHLVQVSRIYIISIVLLASIGWLQLGIWVATGSDPLPVGFFDELLGGQATQRSGVFEYLGGRVYRMSSFGGEPRDLGIGLAVALLLLQAGVKSKGRYAVLLWPYLFVSMLATFSTMAILGWLGATFLQFFVTPNCTFKMPKVGRRVRNLARWTGWLAPILLVVFLSGKGVIVYELIESRTTGRITESEHVVLEDFNIAILQFLVHQPLWAITGTGLGNAHIYADPFLPAYATGYASGTSFVAKSGLLRWVSELGAVTFFVFLGWVGSRISHSVRLAHCFAQYSAMAAVMGKFAFPLIALWLVSSYITMQFYMMIGLGLAMPRIVQARTTGDIESVRRNQWNVSRAQSLVNGESGVEA